MTKSNTQHKQNDSIILLSVRATYFLEHLGYLLRKEYLTIIPRAQMGYESIDHEAEGRMVY